MKNNNFTHKDGVSLRDYIEAKLDAIETATTLAKESMEGRLEGMNEFRAQLKDQTVNFITRAEFRSLEDRVNEVKEMLNKRPSWLITGLFSLLIGLIVFLLTK